MKTRLVTSTSGVRTSRHVRPTEGEDLNAMMRAARLNGTAVIAGEYPKPRTTELDQRLTGMERKLEAAEMAREWTEKEFATRNGATRKGEE